MLQYRLFAAFLQPQSVQKPALLGSSISLNYIGNVLCFLDSILELRNKINLPLPLYPVNLGHHLFSLSQYIGLNLFLDPSYSMLKYLLEIINSMQLF